MDRKKIHYGAAFLAAPLFVLSYNLIFDHNLLNLSPFKHSDLESLLLLIIFYPIVEEIIFRGMIQEYIATKYKDKMLFPFISLANFTTSILFVLMHFIYHEIYWAIMVFVPSVIFGYFKEKFHSILPGILLHMFYNICALFLFI